MTPATVVELDGVVVEYRSGPPWNPLRTTALRGVSLTIGEGETVGLVGESGSGKSTLGYVSVGQLRPTAGTVRFSGTPLPTSRQRLPGQRQAVLQHPEWSLNPRMRVWRSVSEPLAVAGTRARSQRRTAAIAMLDRVGLDARIADRYPHELSGGQRQRVAIARALDHEPALHPLRRGRQRPRRVDSGADHQPDQGPAAASMASAPCSSPTSSTSSATPPIAWRS